MLVKLKDPRVNLIFPQANDIYKLIKYCDVLQGERFKDKLSSIDIDLTHRQKQYYYASSEYLGLYDSTTNSLSEIGVLVLAQDFDVLIKLLVYLILRDKIFYNFYIDRDLEKTSILIEKHFSLSVSTCSRRAENVRSWIKWCDVIINEQNLNIMFEDNND